MKQHRKKRLIFVVFLAILFVFGCEDGNSSNNKGICDPGDVKTCPCTGGQTGVQTCNSEGIGWGVCEGCGGRNPNCISDCMNKECGNDGCRGSCGECGSGYKCQDDQCVEDIYCGDGNCDPNTETCDSCPLDCGSCIVCGNGKCETGEDCDNCSSDCGDCSPKCGNNKCETEEDCDNCSSDCGACSPSCGNKNCDSGENYCNCPSDCTIKCGDECCNGNENYCNCSQDCTIKCGDGCCNGSESYQDCPQDCECVSDCSGKECGDDGCGGNCGTCPAGKDCQGKQCILTTWLDSTTNLVWENTAYCNSGWMNWSTAKQWCSAMKLGGYNDWRVPTISELRSLIRGCPETELGGSCNIEEGNCLAKSCMAGDCSCSDNNGPADGCYWPDEIQNLCVNGCWIHWSSSPVDDIAGKVWVVFFEYGAVASDYVGDDDDNYVRCVR